MKYNLVSVEGEQNLTLFVDGEMYVAHSSHPNFKAIVAGVLADDESVVDLFDVSKTVAEKFERLSERVSVSGGRVFFDGEEVDNSLTKQVVRALNEGTEDFRPLVNFFEKVAVNPSQHSREQFYAWLDRHQFTITEDGNVVMYKGVRVEEVDGETKYTSIHSGPAIVDGEAVNGHVPNNPGSVVEMARGKVAFNPGVGCSTGLHAGTWDYARSFAGDSGAVLKVIVNPRDVVSVPTDCEAQKVRTCRYTVHSIAEGPLESAIWQDDDDEDEEFPCICCGDNTEDKDYELCLDCDEQGCGV